MTATKKINLALQGGGAHGAFTWGVLDRLLDDERIEIGAVTGASAGAMNAVMLADGLSEGGRLCAKENLKRFWMAIGDAARTSPIQRSAFDRMRGDWNLDSSPGYIFFDMVSRMLSPYELNILNYNPLREILADQVDFKRVRKQTEIDVFVSATNVRTGRAEVFMQDILSLDHVMASACLPFMFKAVEIDGEAYWDGGYMGNPPLFPLFDHAESDDLVIVQINPFERSNTPKNARDILNRLNEITFNSSLLRELRAIEFVTRLLDDGRLEGTGYRRVLTHMIGDEETLAALGASSKLNAEKEFFKMLFYKGRDAADGWLINHFDALGIHSSFDIAALFTREQDPLDGARISRNAAYQGGNAND